MTNSTPRKRLALIQRPKENHKYLEPKELKEILDIISGLRSEDLYTIMDAISRGLVKQRNIASYRAVDFECAVANLSRRDKIRPETAKFVLDEFIRPHVSALRTGEFVINNLEERARKTEPQAPGKEKES